jgi:YfiH family protein
MTKLLAAENLSRTSNIAHGFFTCEGGVSNGIYASLNCGPGSNDSRGAVLENRRIALSALAHQKDTKLVTLYQIHSADAVCVDVPWSIDNPPRADAMATRAPAIALGILTADCAPVLLADAEAGVIGAAHAGWRGALAGVIESVIVAMESLGARRARIAAAIGPCISQKNYEVSDDFRNQFLDAESGSARFFIAGARPNHWQFDLEAYVAARLNGAQVGNITTLATCTYAREAEFFSFRRNTHCGETDYGRQISAIMLKS